LNLSQHAIRVNVTAVFRVQELGIDIAARRLIAGKYGSNHFPISYSPGDSLRQPDTWSYIPRVRVLPSASHFNPSWA
jgi:hypothetical protein